MLIDLKLIMSFAPGPLSGCFRLREAAYCETRAGNPYLRFCLEDASGSLPAYAWKEDLYRGFNLADYSLVQIFGQTRYFDNRLRVDLQDLSLMAQKKPIQPKSSADRSDPISTRLKSLGHLP